MSLELWVAGVGLAALVAYALLGGADFGGGVWDLLARGPRREAQRALVADAIGPIWEANHVWLILVVVLCFTCFPAGFARISTVLHVPLTLMLMGVVLRGSAFVFRAYDTRRDVVQRRWGLLFAVASLVTPVLLGIALGALASGAVGRVDLMRPGFAERFVDPWATPFALAVGGLALALFAFLAAAYLVVEAAEQHRGDPQVGAGLVRDFAGRAVAAQCATVLAAGAVVWLAPAADAGAAVPRTGPWAVALQGTFALSVVAALALLHAGRWRAARLAAQAQATVLVWGWAWAQFPAVVPPHGTAAALAAPAITLALCLGTLAAGSLVLLPSFVYLFRVFKGRGSAFQRMG
jgi:cytochrome d ubiquinol oxidase subunit II